MPLTLPAVVLATGLAAEAPIQLAETTPLGPLPTDAPDRVPDPDPAEWATTLSDALLDSQLAKGADAGSWPAAASTSRLVTTALHVLTIEACHRTTRMVVK